MRILMLGNSFTFANDMPAMLAELTGAEVVHHTRGGARLAEQLNPKTKTGAKTQAALENEFWDYVVLQEMSNGPVTSRNSFLKNAGRLCAWIREEGATPLLFATWAYQKDSQAMAEMDISYDEMVQGLNDAYREAADQNDALIAEVGQKFYELADSQDLYAEDGQHPSEAGSRLVAETIAAAADVDMIDVTADKDADLSGYDRIGFASGIYYSSFAKQIIAYAEKNLPDEKPVFFIYTHGAPKGDFLKGIRAVTQGKNCPEIGEFRCQGYDTFGPFKLVGGIAKGHPTEDEVRKAVEFYKGLKS